MLCKTEASWRLAALRPRKRSTELLKSLTIRRLRTALTIAAPVAVFAVAFLGAPSDAARSGGAVAQASTPGPGQAQPIPSPSAFGSLPAGMPTPYPVATLAPARSSYCTLAKTDAEEPTKPWIAAAKASVIGASRSGPTNY